EGALENLRDRAWSRGIRLASDMVPNHTGIDSRWVREHPDWFIQRRELPYPNYSFNGPDLCADSDVAVYIEDGYWNHSDAAVVFKRVDRRTGDTRYIYHGNDGTQMPWNDTAQLNFLDPEVRRAVRETVKAVASRFPIIRLDAAMTLTRDNFRRLWYPAAGSGGAIPSRSNHGLSDQDFDAQLPNEFWREVVDAIAEEMPDTLLLAEAFWLTESYFVRTLGMHRVYNSAFMHMLKDEENEKYHRYVTDLMAYDPEILRRYVNFMSNPDEETALTQFGNGDKYIGVATLMVTMPGLPMFGHGQIEGQGERYGMEFKRAYHDVPDNQELVARHESEVFPLMRRRELFAGVEQFRIYDFDAGHHINRNVWAFSNKVGEERALVFYNNRLESTEGTIRLTSAIGDDDAQANVAEALGIGPGESLTLHHLRGGKQVTWRYEELVRDGIHMRLRGYQAIVLTSSRLD
ncbi:MAG: hypothetical protein KC561_06655, partial [Myxococcales bacterium]|nr:hypothetical protein [Myxococcales bacterium]